MARSEAGSPRDPAWRTAELEPSRWADFETLFRKYDGVQAGCWCMFYHRAGPGTGAVGSLERREQNRRDHRALVLGGRAQGVLVYADDRPVGWCQFGRREDLPRLENGRKYRALQGRLGAPPRWRITCFFVDRPYRRRGVARRALRAALDAMARQGGGIVEAYPSTQSRAVAVWFGTRGMFEREGFRVVRPFGRSNVLVRRTLRAVARKSPTTDRAAA
jgi:GNAT superfamily N-acetyltransferase